MAEPQVSKSQKKVKKCQVPGCDTKHYCKGYCHRHYRQILHYGVIYLQNNRNPNHYEIKGDICFISLYDKNCNVAGKAIIDIKDTQLCQTRKWYYDEGYVRSGEFAGGVRMPHFLLGHKPNRLTVIDHKNRNPLDNRRDNLRVCTQSQNCMNSKISKKNTSGIKGITYNKRAEKWRACIGYNYTKIQLGEFRNKEDAIKARKKAELKYHGEFVPISG